MLTTIGMAKKSINTYGFKSITAIATLLLVSLLFACNKTNDNKVPETQKQTQEPDSVMYAHLHFIEDFFDFGSIKQGEVVAYTFKFTNTGNAPLVIKDIIPDCGCTKSKVSSKLVKPNEVETIEIIFDSSGWRGLQYKSITVRTNGKIKDKSVTIKANVVI